MCNPKSAQPEKCATQKKCQHGKSVTWKKCNMEWVQHEATQNKVRHEKSTHKNTQRSAA